MYLHDYKVGPLPYPLNNCQQQLLANLSDLSTPYLTLATSNKAEAVWASRSANPCGLTHLLHFCLDGMRNYANMLVGHVDALRRRICTADKCKSDIDSDAAAAAALIRF